MSLALDHYYDGSANIYPKELISFDNTNQADVENWLLELPPIESRLWLVYLGKENQLLREIIEENFTVTSYQKSDYPPVFLVEKVEEN